MKRTGTPDRSVRAARKSTSFQPCSARPTLCRQMIPRQAFEIESEVSRSVQERPKVLGCTCESLALEHHLYLSYKVTCHFSLKIGECGGSGAGGFENSGETER
jgi:hypothetical protein